MMRKSGWHGESRRHSIAARKRKPNSKYKVYEVTTQDYGKGYVIADDEKEALTIAKRESPEKFRANMTSYYDRDTIKRLRKKYDLMGEE